MIFRQLSALAAALILCAASARAEVQKFLNPCAGQKLCASYTLVLTPPDGWVVDAKATAENKVQIMVPKGQSFATAEPLITCRRFRANRFNKISYFCDLRPYRVTAWVTAD